MDNIKQYELLTMILNRYDGYYHLSAVKGSLLLTTNIILLAALVSEENALMTIIGNGLLGILMIIVAAIFSLTSIVFSVLVIATYLSRGRAKLEKSIIFSSSVAVLPVDTFVDKIKDADDESLVDDLAHVVHHRAVGLVKKFRWIDYSLYALLAAISVFAVMFLVTLYLA